MIADIHRHLLGKEEISMAIGGIFNNILLTFATPKGFKQLI